MRRNMLYCNTGYNILEASYEIGACPVAAVVEPNRGVSSGREIAGRGGARRAATTNLTFEAHVEVSFREYGGEGREFDPDGPREVG